MSENIEKKWQKKWADEKLFESNPDEREKLFLTVAFPYPSGAMHIGHGRTYTVEGAITASVDLTVLSSDVPALATIFPQYFVAKGGTLSTGEEVTSEDGAIDIVAASCDTTASKYDLEITSCNGETTRLVKARTSLSSVDFAEEHWVRYR